jgi:hypothetical protein
MYWFVAQGTEVQSLHMVAPTTVENFPLGQFKHALCPPMPLYFPTGHPVHAVCPVMLLYVPAAQSVQLDCCAPEYAPVLHSVQLL